jgi:hypothetical protein
MTFASAYLCATGFCNYATTKIKCRNRLNPAQDLIIQPPNIKPNIKRIVEKRKSTGRIENGKYVVYFFLNFIFRIYEM